jgi:hypothetical protein
MAQVIIGEVLEPAIPCHLSATQIWEVLSLASERSAFTFSSSTAKR